MADENTPQSTDFAPPAERKKEDYLEAYRQKQTPEARAEREARLAECRAEAERLRVEYQQEREAIQEALKQLPPLTEKEKARASELIKEQTDLYGDRPAGHGLYEDHGAYSAEDHAIMEKHEAHFFVEMKVFSNSMLLSLKEQEIIRLENEEDIYRWKAEGMHGHPEFISMRDMHGYRDYLEEQNRLRPRHYRASMDLERNKYPISRDSRAAIQLRIGEDVLEDLSGKDLEISGLRDLTVSQSKAVSAIQILLDRTRFEGHTEGYQSWTDYYRGKLPELVITPSEYFEAYGLERRADTDGRYGGKAREEALEALRSLTKERTLVYSKQTKTATGKTRYNAVRIRTPLIMLADMSAYKEINAQQLENIESGEGTVKPKSRKLIITVSAPFVNMIDTFYLLKPTDMYKRIEDYYVRMYGKKKRFSPTVVKMIEYLLKTDKQELSPGLETMAGILNISYLLDTRQKKRAEALIEEALTVALACKYLLTWRVDQFGNYCLTLNPEECKRVKSKQKRIEARTSTDTAPEKKAPRKRTRRQKT